MVFSYRFGNLLAIIKQGQLKKKTVIVYFLCNSILHMLNILYKNGFIYGYIINTFDKKVYIQLKYDKNMQPIIHEYKLLSKPSLRRYITYKKLYKLTCKISLYGLFILQTQRGLITHKEALIYKIGGELVRYIY